jgi:hypothetical protein
MISKLQVAVELQQTLDILTTRKLSWSSLKQLLEAETTQLGPHQLKT